MNNGAMAALRWLIHEIVEESLRTSDVQLMKAFVDDDDLGDVERDAIFDSVFWEALRHRNWTLAKRVIAAGYMLDPESSGDPGVLYMCMETLGDRPDVIQWLISEGAEIERRSSIEATPLITAIASGYNDTVRVLIESGADPNSGTIIDDNVTPLMAAARAGNEAAVRLLLSSKVDRNARDRWGINAVQYAISSGHRHIAKLLQDG